MLTRLELDDAADRLLAAKGYDHDSVPPEGEVVFLRKTANLSTGGTAIDVTDVIHPDNKLMAERAIRAVGLDIGGVDFLTTDITQSYRDTGGAICEINAGPGMRMHIAPSEGKGRDVGGAVMDMLFPAGTPARIPIAALTGTNGKTTTARMLAHVLKMAGHVVGQTSTDAVYIDGNVTVKGDMTGPKSAVAWCCATRPSTWRCSRPPAAASSAPASATASATSAPCSTSPPTTSASAASTRSRSSPRSSAWWSRSPRTPPSSTPTTSTP